MQISLKKTKLPSTIFVTFLLIASLTLLLDTIPMAQAQQTTGPLPAGVTPDFTVETTAYMSIRPATVGLGQTFIVNLFPIPAPNANREFKNMKVTITKPDETTDIITMDSYVADGTAWFEYIADQIGTWKFKFELPGQYFPAGRYANGEIVASGGSNYAESVYYKPSSTKEMTITVQDEMVYSWPDLGLPTDYWTRPVPYEHREWAPIAGDFPWRGPGGGPLWDELYPDTNPYWGGYEITGMGGPWRGTWTPWVSAPDSAHVAWKEQYAIGGIVGGGFGAEIANAGIFGGGGVGRFPEIVYAGRAYHTYTKPGTGSSAKLYWKCYDIRTGELYWDMPAATTIGIGFFGMEVETAITPTVIEYSKGLLPGGQVSIEPEHLTAIYLLALSGGNLYKFDPWTGAIAANISIAPMTGSGGTYYMNGFVLGVQNLGSEYRLINWTTFGTSSNFASRVQSNITWPWSSLPQTTDFQAGIAVSISKSYVAGAPDKTTVRAASLKTGQELWSKDLDEWVYSTNTCYADHGKIAILTEQGYFVALDLRTGAVAWKSEKFDYPWDEPGFGGYNVLSAYGLLFRNAYSGVYAFNWSNGSIAWKYTSPAAAAYETPYVNTDGQTVYSTNIGGAIADGKYFIYNTEHSASVPITRGWQVHAINVTTGEGIWKVMLPAAASKHTTDLGPIADGYLTLGGSDGYMYVFGKGKSETTVTVGPKIVTLGEEVLIEGTVLDMSPAQPGTPCVSKESMALQMEHLHKQLPLHGIWGNESVAGVTLSIVTVDPNGNYRHIGEVNTEGWTGTFGYTWEPDVPGQYKITATFLGDESYGSSEATTYLTVVEPEPTQTPPPAEKPPDTIPYIIGIGVAIIIAVALATLLILRKKP